MANEQAVISPSWSIHSGVGTGKYSFIWGMAGENQTFEDMDGIAPGYMATDNTAQLRADAGRSAEILSRIPAGRWGEPSDLAGAVVFLASPASDHVNGHVLAVDRGWLAR